MQTKTESVRRRPRAGIASLLVGIAVALALALGQIAPVSAGWFTRFIKEAGDAANGGLDAGRHAAQRGAPKAVASLANSVQRITKRDKQAVVVGAAAGGTGEWTFVNAAGEVFTAANAVELGRMRSVLLPDAEPRRAMQMIVSDAAVFGDLKGLSRALPDAEFSVAYGRDKTYALRGLDKGVAADAPPWQVRVRPNVDLELTTRTNMAAALDVLERRLRRDKLTVLALRQRMPKPGPRPLKRQETGGVAGLEVAEGDVVSAMGALRGRTVILTGRVTADTLTYRTALGFDRDIELGPLREAAARNDVTLLLVDSSTPRQPGVRNWLWQKASLTGFEKALAERDLAGMVSALSEGNGRMIARADATRPDRTSILISPEPSALSVPGSGLIGDITATVISETTGKVISEAIKLEATSAARQSELEWRLVPWLPSSLQWGYILSFAIGLAGLPFLRAWWRRIWPPEAAGEYASRVGLFLARIARGLTFLLVFMPLAGVPAAIANTGYAIWGYIMLPFRVVFWIASKFRGQPT